MIDAGIVVVLLGDGRDGTVDEVEGAGGRVGRGGKGEERERLRTQRALRNDVVHHRHILRIAQHDRGIGARVHQFAEVAIAIVVIGDGA